MIKKKNLSPEDKKIWEDFIKNPSKIFDKEVSSSYRIKNQTQFRFDLHGFTLEEANRKVKEIIFSCIERKYKEILLITGKGIHSTNKNDVYTSKDFGKLRFSVPNFIKSDQDLSKVVISVKEAAIKDGGEGAIVIKLRNLKYKF